MTTSLSSTNGADHTLPAILCLHGGGSNATVFKIQTRRLIWNLGKQFRFVFAQAPIEGTPGMGMLPVFESCAPFYRWVNRRFKMGEGDSEATPKEDIEAVDEILKKVINDNGGADSFVGAIGFSQGARLVPGLLLRQMIEKRDLGKSEWKFKFGVMIGGPFPPIAMTESVDVKDYELLRQIPTVHGWGRDDPVIRGAEQMAEMAENENCFVMDFAGGHHLPLKDDEARDLCDQIMAAWMAAAQKSDVKTKAELIKGCGGAFATKISDDVTHLVATPAQFSKNGAKVKNATNYPSIKIVDFEWLNKSLASKSEISVDGCLLDPAQEDAGNGSDTLVAASTTSRKRQRAEDQDEDDVDLPAPTDLKKSKVMQKDGQKAKSRSVNIPVDEHCPSKCKYKVHIDDDGMIFDATLNQTNSGNNNNKFYRLQLLSDDRAYYTWSRWGRVGNNGQSKMLGDGSIASALKNFHDKFKDKNGGLWEDRHSLARPGKYNFLELSYEDSSNEDDDDLPGAGKRRASKDSTESTQLEYVESKLPGPVQRLMKLIFNQDYFNDTLASLDYDTNKMPLGKLSKRTLLRGYEVLKELAALVQNPNTAPAGNTRIAAVTNLSNTYLSLIPHAFGIRRAPILQDMVLIKKEIDLLETLTDMQLANDIMKSAKGNKDADGQSNVMDRQYQGLGMQEMTPLDLESMEAGELSTYLNRSAGATHHMQYKVQDIFRIERQGENDRFANVKNSDRRLLWHGSRATNFGGILSQGLRIAPPEAPVSGYMFGKGVYLADISTKSAGYCASYASGNIALLLLCEAELGRPPLKLTGADYNAGERAKDAKCLSTWGVGQTAPAGWKDAGCVHADLKGVKMPDVKEVPGPSKEDNAYLMYNEYIVYDVAQIRLRYLLRVEMK